ncbi:hypothetical protein ABIB25_000965 [Nakamurella sp. UYEF19]|uniref:hypothetical protein n=1 Tax=Nakamurella sp. UYEF19 TaxID=1756392 RepID=UPI00339A0EF8
MNRIALTTEQTTTILDAMDLLAADQHNALTAITAAFGADHPYTRRLSTTLDNTWATATLIAIQTNDPTPNPTLSPGTRDDAHAYNEGWNAHHNGRTRAAALNPAVMAMIGDAPVGDPRTTRLMKAFSSGYNDRQQLTDNTPADLQI